MTVPITAAAAILCFAWISVKSSASVIVFGILYGFFSGACVAVCTIVGAALSPDLERLGTRMGMLSVPMALGLLIGTPVAGALIQESYIALQVYSGSCMLVATLSFLLTRATKSGIAVQVRV